MFFFNDTATTEIYTLSLHDALPISFVEPKVGPVLARHQVAPPLVGQLVRDQPVHVAVEQRPLVEQRVVVERGRSEEHTSELQSRQYLVCRLLLEKKKKNTREHL